MRKARVTAKCSKSLKLFLKKCHFRFAGWKFAYVNHMWHGRMCGAAFFVKCHHAMLLFFKMISSSQRIVVLCA